VNIASSETSAARSAFFRGFLNGLQVVWPVLSGLIVLIEALGLVVGVVEGWGLGSGAYFAAITALTIGYGDLAPSRALTRTIAAAIGLLGIITTAIVAGVAVAAVQESFGRRRRVSHLPSPLEHEAGNLDGRQEPRQR
jgi:hypothetical protein